MENLLTVLFLVFLEGLLSFDNALALAAMVKPLREDQRKKALTYGMAGAFVFRAIALFCLTWVLAYPAVKIAGAAWLLFVAWKGLVGSGGDDESVEVQGSFLKILLVIELTDIAFSIDSILAAAAVSQIFWVVVVGGIAGIVMMRFVSNLFVGLIARFPRLEQSAFGLVGLVGVKLAAEGFGVNVHHPVIHYGFWFAMAMTLAFGFSPEEEVQA